jgi:hypothetical protein
MPLHPLIEQFAMIKGLPTSEMWFRNAVSKLVTEIQPMLDRLEVLEADRAAEMTAKVDPDAYRKAAR